MGIVSDDATILKIKHEVLTEVAKLAFAGELDEKKENIPYEMIPGPEAHFRCCIYKEREIIRQRVRLAEGKCPGNRESSNIVQVINSACEECPISSGYVVTDLCQGCLAISARLPLVMIVPTSIPKNVRAAVNVRRHVPILLSLKSRGPV